MDKTLNTGIIICFGNQCKTTHYDCEKIVEVVRHAARQLPNRLHLLRLVELFLRFFERNSSIIFGTIPRTRSRAVLGCWAIVTSSDLPNRTPWMQGCIGPDKLDSNAQSR
jgi:hypothetical protein